jgi:hypothetical protein
VQRELRHRRAVPRQRVQHLDWQGGHHGSQRWQTKARRAANARRNERARGALGRKRGAGGNER